MRAAKGAGAIVLFCLAALPVSSSDEALGKRTTFDIPLARLKVAEADGGDALHEVQVLIDGREEYALVAPLNDVYVKLGRSGTKKIEYGESPTNAFLVTDFEAEQIDRAVESLIQTLVIFEKDLKKRRWDRCLYLDSFMPRFLKAFYFLVCAARNSKDGMPIIGRIPEALFDVSLNSPKSDARIAMWREKEYLIKLRIVTREFIFQLQEWQRKDLRNKKRNAEVSYSGKAEEAYALFVKMYFNMKTSSIGGSQRQGL